MRRENVIRTIAVILLLALTLSTFGCAKKYDNEISNLKAEAYEQVKAQMISTAKSMGMYQDFKDDFENIKVSYKDEVVEGSNYSVVATYVVMLGTVRSEYVMKITSDLETGEASIKMIDHS